MFTNLAAQDGDSWEVQRLDLATRTKERLARARSASLSPSVFPGGRVVFNAPEVKGLVLKGRPLTPADPALPASRLRELDLSATGKATLLKPLGDGVDVVRELFSVSGPDVRSTWAVAMHTAPEALPRAFAFRVTSNQPIPIVTPANARVDIAGVLDEPAAPPERPAPPGVILGPPARPRLLLGPEVLKRVVLPPATERPR